MPARPECEPAKGGRRTEGARESHGGAQGLRGVVVNCAARLRGSSGRRGLAARFEREPDQSRGCAARAGAFGLSVPGLSGVTGIEATTSGGRSDQLRMAARPSGEH